MDHLRNIIKEFKNLEKQIIENIYTEMNQLVFAHDAEYSDSEDLPKRFISEKILEERAFEIARNCKYDGYQRALVSMVYKFLDKKTGSGISVNEQLAEELHKPIVYARFKDKIWVAVLAEMRSLSSKNKYVKYLFCVIDAFTKYAWVKPLKDEKM